jgi:NADPH2:quinone reductase
MFGSCRIFKVDLLYMKAIAISRPGPPDVLTLIERPVPSPRPGARGFRVAAAGVNRPDLMQRMGSYPPPPGASDLPGLEVAGAIEAVGPGVTTWKVGDRVCALVSGGGYAEYCVAPAGQCLPFPRGLDAVAAAALPETTFTVWTNVFQRGRLAAGESILIHGGSSGIGTTAIQLARARGARVFTTAGSAEKCRACEELGAERAINYREEDFVAVIKEATDGRGVDVVLDMVVGDYLQRDINAIAMEGRIVLIAALGGATATLNTFTIMQRRLTITGSTLRPRSVAEKSALAAAVKDHVWPIIEEGRMRPLIHQTFPLAAAADAHRVMESGAHVGKLVLLVQS